MKDKPDIETFFRTADACWWNPNCGNDNRFWFFKAQSRYIERELERCIGGQKDITALDAGCGRGIHSCLLQKLGCRTTSLDINPDMLKLTGTISNSTLVEGTLMNMPFDNKTFEIVISIGTSMHVKSISIMLSEIHRVLKNNGIAIISMANKFSLYILWTTKINHRLVQHQKLYHRTQSTFWEFKRMLPGQNFKIISSRGFAVIPPISLETGWRKNLISPLTSKILSFPLDWVLGQYFGCGVTFVIRKK